MEKENINGTYKIIHEYQKDSEGRKRWEKVEWIVQLNNGEISGDFHGRYTTSGYSFSEISSNGALKDEQHSIMLRAEGQCTQNCKNDFTGREYTFSLIRPVNKDKWTGQGKVPGTLEEMQIGMSKITGERVNGFFCTLLQKPDTPLKRIGLLLILISVVGFSFNLFVWGTSSKPFARDLSDLFNLNYQSTRYYAINAYITMCAGFIGVFAYNGFVDKLYQWIKTGSSIK